MTATPLLRALRRFLRDERGSIAIESVLILPVLAWAYMGTVVFFDAFRAKAVNVKAAYTIGDILARQTVDITPEFVDSLHDLQRMLIGDDPATRLRITKFTFRASDGSFVRIWSEARGPGIAGHTPASLRDVRASIPIMADDDSAVLVESWTTYTPSMNVMLDPTTLHELVVMRPRFMLDGRFCWNSVNEGGGAATQIC